MDEINHNPHKPVRKRIKASSIYTLVAVVVICVMVFWGIKQYAAGLAEKKLSAAVGKMSDIMTVTWQNVEVRLLSSDVVVRNLVIKHKDGARATIERALIYDFYRKSPRPNYAAVNLKGLKAAVDETNFGDTAKQIQAWGYKTLNGDVTLDVFFDPTGKVLYINTLEFIIADAGRLRLHFIVDRFNPTLEWPVVFAALVLREGTLEYNDDTLLKKLTEIAWRKDETFMKYLVGEIEYDIVEARKQADIYAVRSYSAFKKFLEKPDKLRLKVKLIKQLNLSHILNVRKASDLLSLIEYRFSDK
jgi:hypothetical protein